LGIHTSLKHHFVFCHQLFCAIFLNFLLSLNLVFSRELAEGSPYLEALRKKDVEVLFCYEPYDELVLMQLRQFDGKNIISVEKEMRSDKESENVSEYGEFPQPIFVFQGAFSTS